MKRFIFFSKTMIGEVPRMRHQLAVLLTSNGHEVTFYQKPSFAFRRLKYLDDSDISIPLQVRQTKQLIHHQLRVFDCVANLNAFYEKKSIAPTISDISEDDIIVNFNYDYFFLRSLFSKNKIITIINDDFVAQARETLNKSQNQR